ncbi:2-phosphosulfolactate phosphatase [Iamia sp. SCSIO 61187]|uniref:2-phosphosulfolactate phosphatase n=1 Tax=Iamia sp. SCSIO 61187 TaxID=2722752 RepID=UPI001C62AC2C|nr:2-phosphosulfolactate phosphatase [Iamia sp. SCSIO 61187]QYG95149.1 2-phosphosulfolactate phosphatase [Iamia sp. SCSIO 61187]
MGGDGARYVSTAEVVGVTGAVVAVDVIRAFTTAAYAFGAGARAIYLVAGVDDALAFVAAHPGSVAMGEMGGLRPDGFALPNSPALAAAADLDGRVVQRTSAGTQGVVAAGAADRLWCASLVCASATAAAVEASGLGAPTYVITGRFDDRADRPGTDDLATAEHIEAVRLGLAPDPAAVARVVAGTDEAARTLALGADHVDPTDIDLAIAVDRFPFAMEVTRDADGLRLQAVRP